MGDPEFPEPTEPAPDEEPEEPAPEDEAPEPVPENPFLERAVQIDAPLEVKTESTLDAAVNLPGEAETVHPEPPGPRTVARGGHNWVPIGPRNVGGRVRAVAIDPTHPQVMCAAAASGGVYKSLDGGESWFPLWHDEPSLSMASLSICATQPEVVWAATGETRQGRSGGARLATAGVLRSVDGGATWTQPDGAEAIRNVLIHAVAAHPTDRNICWAAGPSGVFRTLDGGQTWTRFAAGRPFSDVAYARFGANLQLFLVASGPVPVAGPVGPATSRRGVVVRLDNPDPPNPAPTGQDDPTNASIRAVIPDAPPPDTAEASPHPLLASGSPTPPPAAGARDPADGKIAIHEDTANGGANPVVYVVFADADNHPLGIFRCRNAHTAAATAMTFTRLVPAASFAREEQGNYNLALAVSPFNAHHLAFGMQNLYVNTSANSDAPAAADWLLAQMDDLYHLERGHHADHHALVFALAPPAPFNGPFAAGSVLLWDANDGGLSASGDWLGGASHVPTPLPADLPDARLPLRVDAITWRKRSHGISASQMYDLAQHPRLPTVLGCGFQDNGAWIGTGGPSWQFVLSADGGFVAFDPDDPYRILATWQAGIADCRFPGRLRDALPLLGDAILEGFWPRVLEDGFLSCDREVFIPETLFHPSLPGRVLTARRNRLYGTRATTGDRWQPEPLGHGIEILHEPTSTGPRSSSLEIHDTAGARGLGFPAQRNTTETREDPRRTSRVRSLLGQPFAIPNGQNLRLTFSNDSATGAARAIEVPLTVGADLPASASAAQLSAYLTNRIGALLALTLEANRPQATVLPVLWPRTARVVVASTDTGRARRLRVGGDAAPLLGVVPREYTGADAGSGGQALPAMVELGITQPVPLQPPGTIDLSGKKLELAREGGAEAVTIDFATDVPVPARVRPGDLADALRAKLPSAHYQVLGGIGAWGIRLSATAAAPAAVTLSGDLVADLGADQGLDPGATGRTVRINRRTRFSLSQAGTPPADRHLRIAASGSQTALRALDTAFVGPADLTQVTSVELIDAVRRMIPAAVHVRCDLDIYPDHPITPMFDISREGRVTELAFGPPPDVQADGQLGPRRVWAGDQTGRVFRSLDGAESWTEVPFPTSDRYGSVEAIAVRPNAPDTVIVGVYETPGPVFADTVPFLFRTTDNGENWETIGEGIADGGGRHVGISSIVIDPASPDHVFVGTELGVFESTDGGSQFVAMNQGLPNAPVVDLTFEPSTQMLRAGLWGRGVYERHVGSLSAKDVRLHIRSAALDDGTAQPYPGPDLLALTDSPLRLDASPDIKQTRRDPRRQNLLLDGVEFDDELRHEDVRVGNAFVCVQVHNRGAIPTSRSPNPTARVAVLWAPADDGPPPLPRTLAEGLATGPLAAGRKFDAWTVIADDLFADPHGIGHDIVAPGYPRIAVAGASSPFAWQAADLGEHRRIGLLALCRCRQDELALDTTDLLDLVRTEAKAAYRECDVVPVAEDSRIVLRATEAAGFGIDAPTAGVRNLAGAGSPLGLGAAPAGTLEAQFAQPERYDLSGPLGGFRLTIDHDVTIQFTEDERIANFQRATADEVAAIVNRQLVAAGVPVRAATGTFRGASGQALFLNRLGAATFAASGTAATRLGVTAAQGATEAATDFPHRGPWNLRPGPPPRGLRLVVRTLVEVRLGAGIPGLPDPADATAAEVRAAINRQLAIGGAFGVRAEPRRARMSIRRSATEAAASKVVSGSYALADLVGSPNAIASADERLARLRAVAAQDVDALAAGQQNFLYVRVANVGTVRGDPARVLVYEVTTTVPPVTPAAQTTQPLGVGQSAVLEVPFNLDARPSGSRVLVLAIADTAQDVLAPPDTLAKLDTIEKVHEFCLARAGAAMREFVVR